MSARRPRRRKAKPAGNRSRSSRPLALEACEPRNLLAVFTVTSPLDTGAAGELRWAVNSANANPGDDLINFAPSVNHINLAFGQLNVSDPVTVDGSSPSLPGAVTINAAPFSRVFRVDDLDPSTGLPVKLTHLNLRQGDVSSNPNSQGGAILNQERLEVEQCLISENRAISGGGIANHGYLAVKDCEISENEAFVHGGGGIWNAPTARAVVNGSRVLGNVAHPGIVVSGYGGGILNEGPGSVTITGGSEVIGNVAAAGGGGVASLGGAVLDVDHAFIDSNEAPRGGGILMEGGIAFGALSVVGNATIQSNLSHVGGGIALADHAFVFVQNSVVTGNRANTDGGGIHITGGSTLEMSGSDLTGNQSGFATAPPNGRGGGIFADGFANVSIHNSVINYNGATAIATNIQSGGGVFVGTAVELDIDRSFITGNVAVNGGGLYAAPTNDTNTRSRVSISNSNMEFNLAYVDGGALNIQPFADLHLKCVTISNNQAIIQSGGGIHLNGAPAPDRIEADIVESVITGNTTQGVGGGIASRGGVELTVTNSIIAGNTGEAGGGGLHLVGGVDAAGGSGTWINLSLISENVAVDTSDPLNLNQSGGGLWVGENAVAEISATSIEQNRSLVSGGGIAVERSGLLFLVDSTVSGNESNNGAGVAVIGSNATLLQTTFYANVAARSGGGVFVRSANPNTVDIQHSTLSRNVAARSGIGHGGGVYVSGTSADIPVQVNLDHAVISGNRNAAVDTFDEVYDSGTPSGVSLVAARFSLIRDNSGTSFAPGNPDLNGNLIGTPGAPIDAQLGPLGNSGGPTLTMVPSNSSPVINAGDPFFSGPPLGDQRQLPFKRVALGRIDMGAIEVQPPPPDPDFNDDGVADCHDIDALVVDIFGGGNTPTFDLTGDGSVDLLDLDKWLDDAPQLNGLAITRYLYGDANLDTVVDGEDFLIWNANKFSFGPAWCRGDFNASGFVDGADFVIWNRNKFMVSPFPTGCGLHREGGTLRSGDDSGSSDAMDSQEVASHDLALAAWSANSLAGESAVVNRPTEGSETTPQPGDLSASLATAITTEDADETDEHASDFAWQLTASFADRAS